MSYLVNCNYFLPNQIPKWEVPKKSRKSKAKMNIDNTTGGQWTLVDTTFHTALEKTDFTIHDFHKPWWFAVLLLCFFLLFFSIHFIFIISIILKFELYKSITLTWLWLAIFIPMNSFYLCQLATISCLLMMSNVNFLKYDILTWEVEQWCQLIAN